MIPLDQFVVFDSVRHGESRIEGLGAFAQVSFSRRSLTSGRPFFEPGTLLECPYNEPPSIQDQAVCGLPCLIRQTEWVYPYHGHARRMS